MNSSSCTIVLLAILLHHVSGDLKLSATEKSVQVGESTSFQIQSSRQRIQQSAELFSVVSEESAIQIKPKYVLTIFNNPNNSVGLNSEYDITLNTSKPGRTEIFIVDVSNETNNTRSAMFILKVYKNRILEYISIGIGWISFVAWAVVFYPQIIHNFKRKSVVGLNFDYVTLNVIGHVLYLLFNLGMGFAPLIMGQYAERYPRSVNPVRQNDIYTSMHAVLATILIGFQCCIYEKASQGLSIVGKLSIGIIFLIIVILIGVALSGNILWLDVLYIFSYIKLSINLFKFMPQVWTHYKTKSTQGWNIGFSILDLIGALTNTSQMLFDGYNYANWKIVKENATKFGLGITSMTFDLIFITQHFCLYSDKKDASLDMTKTNKDENKVNLEKFVQLEVYDIIK